MFSIAFRTVRTYNQSGLQWEYMLSWALWLQREGNEGGRKMSVLVSSGQLLGEKTVIRAYWIKGDPLRSLWICFEDGSQRVELHLSADMLDILFGKIANVWKKLAQEES